MINTTITNSYALYGSIIYFVENYLTPSLIENCVFTFNSAHYNLIDLSVSSTTISNTQIQNNTNNLFSLVASNLVLKDNIINNQICLTSLPGCLLQAQQASKVLIKSSKISNVISTIEEGNIYLDSSKVDIDSMEMRQLKSPKIGSCFSSYNSSLNVINSDFMDYDLNCINAYRSNLMVNSSIFNNSMKQFNARFSDYGSLFSSSSKQIIIFNSSFIQNSNILDGSALYIIATKIDKLNEIYISNSTFSGNNAIGKGTIYIYNQNFSILSSNFTNNLAQKGGGIFCNNDGIYIINNNFF